MHILLTDVLTCPRCGPEFGLIVLADGMDDRHVTQGSLGCANCREQYEIRQGVADLLPPGGEALPLRAAQPREEQALRLAALLGVAERPGTVLLVGASADLAAEVASLLPSSQVAASAAPGEEPRGRAVSGLRHGARLPFRDRSLRGVALTGEYPAALVDEAVRLLAPGARIVLDPAAPGSADALRRRGLEVLLEQEGVVVASPSAAR